MSMKNLLGVYGSGSGNGSSSISIMINEMLVVHFLFQLPLVLQIPRLLTSDTSVCLLPYSLLGFGDILVPGKLQFEFSLALIVSMSHLGFLL